jgi:hypothetical protein
MVSNTEREKEVEMGSPGWAFYSIGIYAASA